MSSPYLSYSLDMQQVYIDNFAHVQYFRQMNYDKFIKKHELKNRSGLAKYCGVDRRTISYREIAGYAEIIEGDPLVFKNPVTGKKIYQEVPLETN